MRYFTGNQSIIRALNHWPIRIVAVSFKPSTLRGIQHSLVAFTRVKRRIDQDEYAEYANIAGFTEITAAIAVPPTFFFYFKILTRTWLKMSMKCIQTEVVSHCR